MLHDGTDARDRVPGPDVAASTLGGGGGASFGGAVAILRGWGVDTLRFVAGRTGLLAGISTLEATSGVRASAVGAAASSTVVGPVAAGAGPATGALSLVTTAEAGTG